MALEPVRFRPPSRDQIAKVANNNHEVIRIFETLFRASGLETPDMIIGMDVRLTDTEEKTANLITLSGLAANATDLGAFTGDLLPDNLVIKAAFQLTETTLEQIITAIVALAGRVSALEARMTAVEARVTAVEDDVAALDVRVTTNETAIANQALILNALVSLTGLPALSANLGTFTGDTIQDAATIKDALQAIETDYETTRATVQTEHP